MDTTQGLILIGCGLIVVIILMIVILFKMNKFITETKTTAITTGQKQSTEAIQTPQTPVHQQERNDSELVAVITAAIATMLGTTTDLLVVTSFRKIDTKTKWQAR